MFYSSGNISIGGNQGHNLNFGCFSANADTSFTQQITLNTTTGKVGIQSTNPQSYLHLGNCKVAGSAPVIIFGKNTGGGARNALVGYIDSFYYFW